MTNQAAERLRETLREDGWAEGSLVMGQLDDALAEERGESLLCTFRYGREANCGLPADDRSVHSPEDERKRPGTHIFRHDRKDAERNIR